MKIFIIFISIIMMTISKTTVYCTAVGYDVGNNSQMAKEIATKSFPLPENTFKEDGGAIFITSTKSSSSNAAEEPSLETRPVHSVDVHESDEDALFDSDDEYSLENDTLADQSKILEQQQGDNGKEGRKEVANGEEPQEKNTPFTSKESGNYDEGGDEENDSLGEGSEILPETEQEHLQTSKSETEKEKSTRNGSKKPANGQNPEKNDHQHAAEVEKPTKDASEMKPSENFESNAKNKGQTDNLWMLIKLRVKAIALTITNYVQRNQCTGLWTNIYLRLFNIIATFDWFPSPVIYCPKSPLIEMP